MPGPRNEVDHDVFVVHAEDDTPFVKGELLPMLGLPDDRVILSSELPFPAFTEQAIEGAVRRSRLTLAVVSPAYLRDRWAGFAELLSRNVLDDARGGSLVPLLVGDCEVPAILAQHELLDCRTPQQRLAAAARLRARLGQPDPAVEEIACPYPGMQPFSAATASRFHGRTKEIDEILGRLQAGEREIFVIGPSGSGKSSLIAAGVLPRVHAQDALLGGLRFAVRTFRPGEHPMQRLAETHLCDLDRLESSLGCWLELKQRDRLLIFIDQFEELFALADAKERQDFARALRVLRADRRCHLIMALRADFYGALMSSELWPDIDGRFTRLEVGPLRGDALREAIEAPAQQAGVYLERALVERLMADAAAEPGALPLLQEALVLLWARRSHRLLRLSSYEALGSEGRSGLAVALARRADAVLHNFTAPQQTFARRILLRLVSFGEGRPDTRRQLPRTALLGSEDDAANVERVIDRLIDDRMLTSDTTTAGEPLIDLSHEALITGWPEFQGWLQSRRDDEQRRRRLELHATEWVQRGRGAVGLFDAIELAEAERWLAGETARELGCSDDLPQFLAASRAAIEEAERQKQLALSQQAHERQAAQDERVRLRRRLARLAFAALGLLLLVISIAGMIARQQRGEARLQLGLNEQQRAELLLIENHDPLRAAPHLVQAVTLGADSEPLRTLVREVSHGLWKTAVRYGTGPVQSAVFSPDGKHVVTASSDGTARVWDADTGRPIGAPLKHQKVIRSAAFSPDGVRVVTASDDGTVRIWDASTGLPIVGPFQHAHPVTSAAFSPDSMRVLTTSEDGTVRIWDVSTGQLLVGPFQHEHPVTNAAFSPDGTRIATFSYRGARIWDATTGTLLAGPLSSGDAAVRAPFSPDGSRLMAIGVGGGVYLWDATTGRQLVGPFAEVDEDEQGHPQALWSAAFSADGTRIVTAATDGTVCIWDAATGTQLARPLRHDKLVITAAFSADGTRIVTGCMDGTARIWDAATGILVAGPLHHEKAVLATAISPDGSRVLTAGDDGTARIWDATTGTRVGVSLPHQEAVSSAAFSPDGTRVITRSGHTTRIWEVSHGLALGAPWEEHEEDVGKAVFAPDGRHVISATGFTIRVWDTVTGSTIGRPIQYDERITSVALSPDGTRIIAASTDGTARIWNAATAAQIGIPLEHKQSILSVAFSPDSTRVATASWDASAQIWSSTTGARLSRALDHEGPVDLVVFSPDGTHLATASGHDAFVWDVATGNLVAEMVEHEGDVASIVFSPDGTRLVTASKDGSARIWDAASGTAVGLPLKHDDMVHSAAFSPDGNYVVTASADGTARLWNTINGSQLGLPLRHDKEVYSAAFSPDGRYIVTASNDATARLWTIAESGTLSDWAEQARRCVIPAPGAVDASVVCPLSEHKASCSDLLARARSMIAVGDTTLFSRVWAGSEASYRQALSILDATRGLAEPACEPGTDELRRQGLIRMAVLDVIAHRLIDARKRFPGDAPTTDALLLGTLGEFAHDKLTNDAIALELLREARKLDLSDVGILANLAQIYFATGQYADFATLAAELDTLNATSDVQLVIAAFTWAAARLTGTPDGAPAERFLRAYRSFANRAHIAWSWNGTTHALKYGRYRLEDVRPVLEVLSLLEQPVTDEARAQLAKLLQAHNPSGNPTK